MLGDRDAAATVAVKDLARAKRFYGETLGLREIDLEGEEAVLFKAGKTTLFVYRSDYAGTNQATAVTWDVGPEVVPIVGALREKGVRFEHYPKLPGLTLQGDLHVAEGVKLAWFKDPDGNIHALSGE